ncbi:MAG: ECF-type sigma factor [Phycisphaerales bacterium]
MDTTHHITHFTRMGDARDETRDGFCSLFLSVYSDLEAIAHGLMMGERAGHTLGTHGLVNESFARLIKSYQHTNQLESIAPDDLRALTSVVMRRVLVDHARKRNSRNSTHAQYAGHAQTCTEQLATTVIDLVTLDESLSMLETIDPQKARIVELRFFGGLSMPRIAELTGKPLRSVERDWSFARAWLCAKLADRSTTESAS